RTLYELLVEIRQVLGGQYKGKITREEEWIVGTSLKENKCDSVLGRVRGCLGHRDHRLDVRDDTCDPWPHSQPRAEIVLQNRENADGVFGQLLREISSENGVVSGQRAVEVGL